jgi:beta-galactosidase
VSRRRLAGRLGTAALAVGLLGATGLAGAERVTLPLDGTWEIADGVAPEAIPTEFGHTVEVPGLVHNAQPTFPDVDGFESVELVSNRIRQGILPESARVAAPGVSRQRRDYFWYRRTFTVPASRAVATLRVNKAQFGTAVWLNGRKVGEYPGCFSAGVFDVTAAMRWDGENVLLVRVGAHPGVLPPTYPAGTDFEKRRWTPGIYDRVTLELADDPVIEWVQVAPRIATSEILVQTRVRNHGRDAVSFDLGQRVTSWRSGDLAAEAAPLALTLGPGEARTVEQTLAVSGAHLWSPEDPFLYVLGTATGGDSLESRFGMREFRFDTATRRAWLNGKVYFPRGSNITLHRFFEDPQSGRLPWDETWVRRLLVDIPRSMHWNAFRFCIGPVPDRWLEIADEAGLLIQNEFFVWTGAPAWDPGYARHWDANEMVRQYSDWMRDSWNHPSVVIWDANNESLDPVFGERVIPAVRGLDLSSRPWENSYNQPVGPDDPIEDHPYLFYGEAMGGGEPFAMTDLVRRPGGPKEAPKAARAMILNEYGWLWIRRDGEPTLLTEKLYPKLLGPNATAGDRIAEDAYLLAALTEYWRAHRNYAAILHFVYLTCSFPGVFTADHFADVPSLTLHAPFADYMGEAMKPLGVYLAFFDRTLVAGGERTYRVMMVNDTDEEERGELRLEWEAADGTPAVSASRPFSVSALGASSFDVAVATPAVPGAYLLKATAVAEKGGSTLSRRKVRVEGARP